MNESQVHKDLVAVNNLLSSKERWVQGYESRVRVAFDRNNVVSYCLRGAAGAVTNDSRFPGIIPTGLSISRYTAVMSRLLDSIAVIRPDQALSVIRFNDHPATTFEDVRAVLRHAIAATA